jgi:ketosteroid isomerase-like protein
MMKKLLIVALSFCLTLAIQAQSKKEAAVANAVEQLRVAMVSGERAALEKITHDKLSYGHSGGAVEDKAAFVEKIASGKSDFVSIDLAEQTISVSGKTAIVRHLLYAKTNDGGKPGEVHLRILLIFQKEGGKWKLLARQAVKI